MHFLFYKVRQNLPIRNVLYTLNKHLNIEIKLFVQKALQIENCTF
jgi:hypothetical protein